MCCKCADRVGLGRYECRFTSSELTQQSTSTHELNVLMNTKVPAHEGGKDKVSGRQVVAYKNTQKHKTEPAGFEPARLATTDSEQKVSYSSLSD